MKPIAVDTFARGIYDKYNTLLGKNGLLGVRDIRKNIKNNNEIYLVILLGQAKGQVTRGHQRSNAAFFNIFTIDH